MKNKFLSKIDSSRFITLLTLILPIINSYRFLPISMIYVYSLIVILLFLLKKKGRVSVQISYISYVLYVLVVSLVTYIFQSNLLMNAIAIRLVYFILIFISFYVISIEMFDVKYAIHIYSFFCVSLSTLMIAQYIGSIFGHPFSLILPNMVSNTGERDLTNTLISSQYSVNRFSTFFLEPAHQAQYTIPCLALVLFNEFETIEYRKRNNLTQAIVMTIAIMATTSMQGILSSGVIWTVYLYFLSSSKKLGKKGKFLFLIPIIIAVIYISLKQPVIQEQILKKKMSINHGQVLQGTSMYRRIIYGWQCYFDYDFIHKIFGCGYDNAGQYLLDSGIGTRYVLSSETDYMSGLSKLFAELGVVGALEYMSIAVIPGLKYIKDRTVLSMLICWLLIMLSSDSFDKTSSLIPMIFILSISKSLNNKREHIIKR